MKLSPESLKRIRSLIAEYNLQAVEDQILAESVECITILRGEPDQGERIGNSRYGGMPDLPPSLPWPRLPADYYRPLAYPQFIMQLNLAEFPIGSPNRLPNQGMLYFFVTFEGVGCVLFHPKNFGLIRAMPPPKDKILNDGIENLRPHQLRFMIGADVPNLGTPLSDEVKSKLGEDSEYQLNNLADQVLHGTNAESAGHVFGSPLGYYEDYRESAAIAKLGFAENRWDPTILEPHRGAISAEQENWLLLWRIESDFEVGARYWDAGTLTAMIRKDDLERLDFSHVYVELTST